MIQLCSEYLSVWSIWLYVLAMSPSHSKCTAQISTQNTAQSFGQFHQMVQCSFTNQVVLGSSPVTVTKTTDFASASSKEFLDIQANTECGFTLKRVRDMTRTYSQMHCTDKYSEQSSIIWPVCRNGWVFIYELTRFGFEFSCSHLNFTFRACFEQGDPWHSRKYRVWIQSEIRTWHDENIQSNVPYR